MLHQSKSFQVLFTITNKARLVELMTAIAAIVFGRRLA